MKNNKKILVFIDWYEPGFKAGGPIRSCVNLVAHLSDRFKFYIVTRDVDYCEDQPYKSIYSDQWNKLDNGSEVFYVSTQNLNFKSLKKIANSIDFDVVYINGIYSKYFSIFPLLFIQKRKKSIIVAVRGMLASSAIGVKPFKKKLFLGIARFFRLYKNVTFQATNEKEKQDVHKFIGTNATVKIASNLPTVTSEIKFKKLNKNSGELKLINIARVSPEKNLKQLLEVLVDQQNKIKLDIYGPIYDMEYWNSCKNIIASTPQNIEIEYCGILPSEDILDTISNYHFLVLFSLGENFGHVIAESFMASRPVIISDQTPWLELEQKKLGWNLGLDDNNYIAERINYISNLDNNAYADLIESCNNYAKLLMNDISNVNDSIALFEEE